MTELTGIQHTVLETLSIQTSGYLTSSNASAFVAVGLEDAEEVNEVLVSLQDEGFAEFIYEEEHRTIISVEKDEEGNPILDENGAIKAVMNEEGEVQTEDLVAIVDEGWVITDKGLEALK